MSGPPGFGTNSSISHCFSPVGRVAFRLHFPCLGGESVYRRVVVPLDGSPVAEAILRSAPIPVFLMRMTEAGLERPSSADRKRL